MKKPKFAEGQIYHIYNRGVEKRDVFLDDEDYLRFIHNLFEFNDDVPVINAGYNFSPETITNEFKVGKKPRKLLVDILAFTLMPNHFHLLLRQHRTKGTVKFMQKLGTGYTMYFNKKYDRVGGLFQGRFKAVLVDKEVHLIHLPNYIHINPLNLNYRGSTSIEFLENYRWSSFPDYIGKKNFPSVTNRELILNMFNGEEEYRKHIEDWVAENKNEKHSDLISDVLLD
jgi:putative transposase